MKGRVPFVMAERVGFEPTNTLLDITGIPVQRLRPLGHLSIEGGTAYWSRPPGGNRPGSDVQNPQFRMSWMASKVGVPSAFGMSSQLIL